MIPGRMNIQCSIQSSGSEQLWSALNLLSFPCIEPLIKTESLEIKSNLLLSF